VKIYPIVEGEGEVEAVPVLLRRLFAEMGCFTVSVGRPIRRTQAQLHNKTEIQKAVRLAKMDADCAAVLILFDGEDVCPVPCADRTRSYVRSVARKIPCEIVVAYREYETWFISAIESLHGVRGVRDDAVAPENPEARRDSKGWLEEFMGFNSTYSPTIDQAAMSSALDFAMAHQRNRSFRKFVRAVGEIVSQLGHSLPDPWPPQSWRPN